MSARHHYRKLTCALCALVAALTVVLVDGPTSVDGPLLDVLIKAREAVFPVREKSEQSPVVVIALDKRSLAEPEIATYPRIFLAPAWASLLDAVFKAQAQAVGFDIIFSYSANRFKPDFDVPFFTALDRYRDRIVLARSATTLPAPPYLASLRNDPGALGLAELNADPDGTYRRVRANFDSRTNSTLVGFAAALLRRAKAPPMPNEVILAPRRHLETITTYALIDVLRCAKGAPEVLEGALKNKIILVGGTLAEEDRKMSSGKFLTPQVTDSASIHPCGLKRLGASLPGSRTVPAVFIHAAAVEAVVSGHITSTVPMFTVASLAAMTATAGVALGLFLTPWLVVATIGASAVALFGIATAMLSADIWLPLGIPIAALVITPAIAFMVRYLVEERARRQIEHAFSHYLSPVIVDQLVGDTSTLKLGGQRREVTVMFADLSGFTALSSKVQPEILTGITNRYLAYVVEQVETTGGYVDKFIGDAVMAIWGAPAADTKHAIHGIRAAMAAVFRIRQEREAAEARGEISFSIKIGLNSGPAVIGNVGTEKRYNYTAVGETVNVASRLEGTPNIYGCQIVVGPRTAELAKNEFLMRELDTIRVRGVEASLTVFEPIVEKTRASQEQMDRVRSYGEALTHYRAMRFDNAIAIWTPLALTETVSSVNQGGKVSVTLNPPAMMAERARALAATPPNRPWDGVWTTTEK